MSDAPFFLEVDYHQVNKNGMSVPGDVFLSVRGEDDSVVTVLSDGLGSGIKANVLATLTAKMAAVFVGSSMNVRKSAEIIIDTLPVCSERKIGYSTFTVARITGDGMADIIEYDNPRFLLLRKGKVVEVESEKIELKPSEYKDNYLNFSSVKLEYGDRLVFFSDGVTQAGMGRKDMPLGWGDSNVRAYLEEILAVDPSVSARKLSRQLVTRAIACDIYKAHDDITCEVIYCRPPRNLLVVTGPSMRREKDKELADLVKTFAGSRVLCGGTTSQIIARELNLSVEVDLSNLSRDIPPASVMEGFDLVTEGILTLCRVSELLENGTNREGENNAAVRLVDILLNNDIIHFVVGTKINEAHQDPNMPVEIEIRRNIVKKIIANLEEKHMKKTTLQFI